mgnify:FL=1
MIHTPLKGKRILFFCPKTFGYESEIFRELEEMGADVNYRSDRPSEHPWIKGFIRLFPQQAWCFCDLIYSHWIDRHGPKNCDFIFIIRGEGLSPNFIQKLRKRYPQARVLLHLWDNVANIKKVEMKFKHIDEISSYDPVDCDNFKEFRFRPLFFIDKYLVNSVVSNKKLFFVGTLHSDRAKVIYKIKNALSSGTEFDYWLFIRSKWEYWFRILFDPYFRKLDSSRLIFKPMQFEIIANKLKECSIVIDIEHPNNSGLTMRTFEMLASGKKLITTNHYIKQHDFYDSTRINVIDRTNPILPPSFFGSDPILPSETFVKRYSLQGWLSEIFGV